MDAKIVVALVEGIGPDSALARAIEPKTWIWSTEDELLAVVAEQVDRVARVLMAGFSDGKVTPKPLKLTRPTLPESKKGITKTEFRDMLRSKRDLILVKVRRKEGDEPSG